MIDLLISITDHVDQKNAHLLHRSQFVKLSLAMVDILSFLPNIMYVEQYMAPQTNLQWLVEHYEDNIRNKFQFRSFHVELFSIMHVQQQ